MLINEHRSQWYQVFPKIAETDFEGGNVLSIFRPDSHVIVALHPSFIVYRIVVGYSHTHTEIMHNSLVPVPVLPVDLNMCNGRVN